MIWIKSSRIFQLITWTWRFLNFVYVGFFAWGVLGILLECWWFQIHRKLFKKIVTSLWKWCMFRNLSYSRIRSWKMAIFLNIYQYYLFKSFTEVLTSHVKHKNLSFYTVLLRFHNVYGNIPDVILKIDLKVNFGHSSNTNLRYYNFVVCPEVLLECCQIYR